MPITYDRKSFFGAVHASVFHGAISASQAAGTGAILDAWERLKPAGDTRFIAYMLATAYHETAATMQPIEEYGHGRGRAYGAPAGPWHKIYDGRGDVQITWAANYRHATARLRELKVIDADIDLERNPELAMRADIAAAIMFYGMIEGWFTSRKLADYFHGLATDWVGARRIINGTDRAAEIAAIAEHFFAALKAAMLFAQGAPATSPATSAIVVPPAPGPVAPAAIPAPAPAAPPPSAPPGMSLLARIIAALHLG